MALYVSDLLTATAAPVSAAPTSTRTWQWLRGSTNISGATSTTYTVVTADLGSSIFATQLETNFLGTTRATSAPTETVQAFDPIRLFSASEPGVWYDPNDISTLFKGPSTIAQVAAPGDTVWTMLDKSQGGPGPELILNGTFDTNIANWTLSGVATATVSSSGATVTNNGTDGQGLIRQAITSVVGRTYKLQLDITSTVRTRIAGTGGFFLTQAIRNGTFSVLAVATGTTLTLDLIPFDAGGSATFDNVSIKEVPGNHATQATTASQPTYGIVPAGGRRNLLTYSEDLTNAVWTKAAASVPATNGTAPDGTLTADTLREDNTANTHAASQVPSASASTAYTVSTYFKREAGTRNAYLQVNNNSGGTGGACFAWFDLTGSGTASAVTDLVAGFTSTTAAITSVGSSWYRCTLSFTTVASTTSLAVFTGIYNAGRSYTGDNTSGIYIWGAQLEQSATATPYQRVTTQYDVTEAGVASLGYLFFDGSGDFMSTGTITPGTDKAQVFTGVRKLDDTPSRVLVEYSPTVNTSPGSFGIFAPSTASYTGSLNGSAQSVTNIAGFPAPITNVISALYNIAGATIAEESIYRINGVVPAQTNNGVAAGTGNFGNYSLNIGYRPATGLYLWGHIHSLIVRFGPNLTTARISATESWVASKTAGATL